MKTKSRRGFTLIELLIFSAIFALIIGVFVTIFIEFVSVQSNQSASGEAQQQGQFLDQQLQYYIGSARLVDMTLDTATSSLTLRETVASSSFDPTTFTLSSGTVYLQKGISGTPQALTSNRVTISNLLFTRHYSLNSSSSALGTDSVSYSYTVSATQGTKNYSQVFQSSMSVSAPVPAVALIQQTKAVNDLGGSVSSLVAQYPTANESGDLLLAVVAYRGTGTSSISDTLGNAWTQVTSTSTVTPVGTLTLYESPSANAGMNTTTVTFASGATYASVFTYEYRGTHTANPVDTYGTQNQVSVSTPSSPTVSPSSTVELIFGVDFNVNPTTAAFSPGSGYTLETSSTALNTTQVFVEDTNQNVTSPVAAAWTSSVNTSSTALIATFIPSGYPQSYNNGLLAYYTLDEGSGSTVHDTSGNGITGTWNGSGGHWTATSKVGANAGLFNGTNDYVDLGNSAALQLTSGTISSWIKTSNAGSSASPMVVKPTAYGVFLLNNVLGLYDWGSGNWRMTALNLADNTWHLVTCTFQSGVSNGTLCYVDGVLQLTTTMSVSSQGNSATIGYGAASGQYFGGIIDDARIYNRILSAAEISAMYNAQK